MGLFATLRFASRVLALRSVPRREPQEVARLQRTRLRALLAHAVRHAPLYADKYRGIDVGRCALADLPPTTKGEIMGRLDDALTDPRLHRGGLERLLDDPANHGRRYLDGFAVGHTSGSSGQPLILVQDRPCLDLLFALQMSRGNVATPVTWREGVARLLRPVRLAAVLMKEGFYPSVSAFDHMPAGARGLVRVLRVAPSDADLVERLNAYRPHVLVAYAGVLEGLALRGGLDLRAELRQVVNTSEQLTERTRARLRQAFDVPVLDDYACGECPFLCVGCPAGPGCHVNADWAVLEVVDAAGRPVPPGQTGEKVYVTNLANFVQPIVRYEVQDRVRMADRPCGCGNRMPLVAAVEGRASDVFWVGDAAGHRPLMQEVFTKAFLGSREVREWQAVQEERDRVRVWMEVLPGARFDRPRAEAALRAELERFGFRGLLEFRLEEVAALRAEPGTGKFKRMVSRVGPPAAREPAAAGSKLGAGVRPG